MSYEIGDILVSSADRTESCIGLFALVKSLALLFRRRARPPPDGDRRQGGALAPRSTVPKRAASSRRTGACRAVRSSGSMQQAHRPACTTGSRKASRRPSGRDLIVPERLEVLAQQHAAHGNFSVEAYNLSILWRRPRSVAVRSSAGRSPVAASRVLVKAGGRLTPHASATTGPPAAPDGHLTRRLVRRHVERGCGRCRCRAGMTSGPCDAAFLRPNGHTLR